MNRRDVIIIAVLVNAGLLVVLFASALKSGNDQPTIAAEHEPVTSTPVLTQAATPPPRGDEVDQVLSQFAAANSPAAVSQATATPVLQPLQPSMTDPAPVDVQSPLPGFSNDLPNLSANLSVQETPAPSFAPAVQEEKSEPSFKEVKVKKGDALEKIARTHHTTVQEIMRANRLASTQLKIGQVLKIPSKGKAGAVSTTVAAKGESKFYTVKNGDNPWTIAVKNHIKVDELLKLNGLDEEKARKLKPGDQLRIR